ncbi:hypothetical protein GCM10027517_00850 [Phycicoccus ginsengisoli]
MSLPATAWPASASSRSTVLDGADRCATVLAAFAQALYLDVDGALLPVVTARALRLPTALVVSRPLPPAGWGLRPGAVVAVGWGRVRLPGRDLVRVRTWTPQPVRAAPAGRWWLGALEGVTGSHEWRAAAADAARRATAGGDLAGTVGALVGAGHGLTPSGDDVLCGVLLGLRLAGRLDAVARLRGAVRPLLGATTTLSAALLTEAGDGYAVPELVRLSAALAGGDPAAAATAARDVAAIGHSSGRDLLAGFLGTLEALSPALEVAS